jgi:hypothetical protein
VEDRGPVYKRRSAQMSVVLATDRYETIRPVIDRLASQTAREKLELVLVGPLGEGLGVGAELDGFAAVQVVEVGSPVDLGEARAAGVYAASAPLVFIGETHVYPDPRMAEVLIRAHRGPWAVVVPAFGNANPDGAASWSGFLLDYGSWVPGIPAGEIRFAPIYNASYRRSALLEFGDRLGSALRFGDEMPKGLRARNHRVYFEPAARIDHLNLTAPPAAWVRERYLAGLLIAAARVRRWSWGQRLLYLFGTPLLPGVYLSRVWAGVRARRRDGGVPLGTVPMMLVSAVLKAAGELIGYARGDRGAGDERMTEYEIHRAAYVSSRPR